jgi:1,4-alpha-glucan branching enzyme
MASIDLCAVRDKLFSLPQDNPLIQEQVSLIGQYLAELDSNHPNAHLISIRRRRNLEDQIDKLFWEIQRQLDPPAAVAAVDLLEKQIDELQNLALKLGVLDSRAFYKELKKIDSDVIKRICQLAFLFLGCSKRLQPNRSCLQVDPLYFRTDTTTLKKELPSLVGVGKGTILVQVRADLQLDFKLTEQTKKIDVLIDVANSLRMNRSVEDINKKFQALPENLRKEIVRLTTCANPTAEKAIFANIVERLIGQEQLQLEVAMRRKVQFFRECYAQTWRTKFQMLALFNGMPTAVQNQLRSIGFAPPFYGRGFNPKLYETLGAHFNVRKGCTSFRLYAPNADEVLLNLTAFNRVEHCIKMLKDSSNGVWMAETDKAPPGRSYHFMVKGKGCSEAIKKVDPFAFQNIIHDDLDSRINHESIVADLEKGYLWSDHVWMSSRTRRNVTQEPLSIYEVHPTWLLSDQGKLLNWRDLVPKLTDYCKINGYNAVEWMALFAHPQPISMGYQITNFFAPNSEMGTWEDFQWGVNYMHNNEIYVFVDWVPCHFALDSFALSQFDGTAIFEDDDPVYASHPDWGTKVFDFKKKFTRDFLASLADFLLSELHVDGLRFDAVASMIYLNYSRPDHHKRYNKQGREVNLEAVRYMAHLNAYIHREYPGVLTMAEESSGFPGVTLPPEEGGLGFSMVWHMGFMNDTLKWWKKSPHERKAAFSSFVHTVEGVDDGRGSRGSFVMAYSHDENANDKGTILSKMWGASREEKFANGRLALAYQLLRGGGVNLTFMGNETLQPEEWHGILIRNHRNRDQKARSSFQWEKLDPTAPSSDFRFHRGAQASCRDLNLLYSNSPALWNHSEKIFWIQSDFTNAVLSFHRRSKDGSQQFACIFNTGDADVAGYCIVLPDASYAPELDKLESVKEIYNTDDFNYGGQGRLNPSVEILRDSSTYRPTHFKLRLPPYTAIVLDEKFF